MEKCDIFGQCRAAVSAAQAASFYGYTPNRAGFISCPLPGHGTDGSPSLKLYPDGGWYCFGCNKGGSSIDFVAAVFGLTLEQAEAIRLAPALEAWSDALFGTIEEQMFIFENRKVVSALCDRTCKNLNSLPTMLTAS